MNKTATVSARIDENLKSEAEEILTQLGIPVSVVINTLYHQIIIQKGIPFPLTLTSRPPVLEGMSEKELSVKLQHSYNQVQARKGRPLEEVFSDFEKKHSAL